MRVGDDVGWEHAGGGERIVEPGERSWDSDVQHCERGWSDGERECDGELYLALDGEQRDLHLGR